MASSSFLGGVAKGINSGLDRFLQERVLNRQRQAETTTRSQERREQQAFQEKLLGQEREAQTRRFLIEGSERSKATAQEQAFQTDLANRRYKQDVTLLERRERGETERSKIADGAKDSLSPAQRLELENIRARVDIYQTASENARKRLEVERDPLNPKEKNAKPITYLQLLQEELAFAQQATGQQIPGFVEAKTPEQEIMEEIQGALSQTDPSIARETLFAARKRLQELGMAWTPEQWESAKRAFLDRFGVPLEVERERPGRAAAPASTSGQPRTVPFPGVQQPGTVPGGIFERGRFLR